MYPDINPHKSLQIHSWPEQIIEFELKKNLAIVWERWTSGTINKVIWLHITFQKCFDIWIVKIPISFNKYNICQCSIKCNSQRMQQRKRTSDGWWWMTISIDITNIEKKAFSCSISLLLCQQKYDYHYIFFCKVQVWRAFK